MDLIVFFRQNSRTHEGRFIGVGTNDRSDGVSPFRGVDGTQMAFKGLAAEIHAECFHTFHKDLIPEIGPPAGMAKLEMGQPLRHRIGDEGVFREDGPPKRRQREGICGICFLRMQKPHASAIVNGRLHLAGAGTGGNARMPADVFK